MGTGTDSGNHRATRTTGDRSGSGYVGKWTIVVTCLNCRYTKNMGAVRLSADVDADRHLRRFPEHVILVVRNEVIRVAARVRAEAIFPPDELPF